MDPQAALNPEMIKYAEYAYFAGGIAVIILGGAGTIFLVLGILKIKFLKPFKQKYPYEQFKSFEEFASRKPVNPDGSPGILDPQERIQRKEEMAKDAPVLTWENAPESIESLTKDNVEKIQENTSADNVSSTQDTNSVEKPEKKEEIPVG
ncbi:hypothetical protein J7L05_07245 [bacterium]|nr:hypothetical protein [bacterium]